jgi:hypothetical protein
MFGRNFSHSYVEMARTRKVKHNHSRRASRTRRHKYHQKAGGDWQSFCAACGKPLSNWVLDSDPFNLPDAQTIWMNTNIGFDRAHGLIVTLGADDMLGTCPITEEQTDEMNDILAQLDEEGNIDTINEFHILSEENEYIDPEHQIGGIVIHEACVRKLERLGLEVNFDLAERLYKRCGGTEYQGQEYDWEAALAANPNHYKSPLRSKSSANEFLFRCAQRGVRELYVAPIVQEELARRRRIVNSKRYANVTRKVNMPMNIKTKLGSYLSEESRPGNMVVPGPIQEYVAHAAAAMGGAGGAGAGPARNNNFSNNESNGGLNNVN